MPPYGTLSRLHVALSHASRGTLSRLHVARSCLHVALSRSFCYVDDLLEGLMRLMNQEETVPPPLYARTNRGPEGVSSLQKP